MRVVIMLAGLTLLLGACRQEPSFDERYSETEQNIRQRAAEIDKQVAAQAPTSTEPAEQ